MEMTQPGFFDLSERYLALSECNDPLERLNGAIDWSLFQRDLQKAFKKIKKSAAGRKPFPRLLMFKVLVLQSLYNLSDAQTEFQLRDRLSFIRFVGLSLEDRVPDEKTIWAFREHLIKTNTYERLFNRFDAHLNRNGFCAAKGTIIDASLMPARIQRNNDDETAVIKAGCVPNDWLEQPKKVAQKDIDARWAMKDQRSIYGYKNHIGIDVEHKLIRAYEVTHAALHDSLLLPALMSQTQHQAHESIYADRAYQDHKTQRWLHQYGFTSRLPYRRTRKKTLSAEQIQFNKAVSKVRIRVEHVFAFIKQSMHQRIIRCIGLTRARAKISLVNLVYNLCRYEQLTRHHCA